LNSKAIPSSALTAGFTSNAGPLPLNSSTGASFTSVTVMMV